MNMYYAIWRSCDVNILLCTVQIINSRKTKYKLINSYFSKKKKKNTIFICVYYVH